MAISENEEFEFRARLEREKKLAAASQMGGESPSALQMIGAEAQRALAPQALSPQSLLQMIPQLANRGADKLGTFAAEELGRKQANPYVAAGVGTAISMAPDLAMMGINPMAGDVETIPDAAIGAQRRALGFKPMELKTEFGRGKAAEAAKVALEQGVTSATGSPKVMFRKASDLAAKSGQKIGEIRESVGPQPIKKIVDALEDYKSIRLKGASGGKWDAISNKIDEAKETITGLVKEGTRAATPKMSKETGLLDSSGKEITKIIPARKGYTPPASLKRIADAKKEIGQVVNWFAENVSQAEAKKLTGVIEKASEKVLAEAGGDIKTYKALKPIYGAAKNMLKGLNRELGAQEGNMGVSLPAITAGASANAPAKAIAQITAAEFLKRRGAGIGASEIKSLANAPKNLGTPAIVALKTLTEEIARKFLRKNNWNPEKARNEAQSKGYTVQAQ